MDKETGRCVIIGGSIAGTLAAAAAATVFKSVLVLDRDKLEASVEVLKQPNTSFESLSEEARQHRSVQQGLQMHGLLAGGGAAFERLLPGFKQQCINSGAKYMADDVQVGKQISMAFGRQQMVQMPCPEGYSLLLATRVLFERCARATLLEQNENVRFCSSHKVEDLLYDEASGSVRGVRLASGEELPAEFVVDTTGGRSHAVVKFLEEKCGQKVNFVKFDVGLNYHTRFFKMPEKVLQMPQSERVHFSMCAPRAPDTDSGLVMMVEGNMYQALVSRMNRQKCGSSVDDFLAVLKGLPVQGPYNAVKDAEAIGPSFDYLGAQGTVRHFYEHCNMPESYVVLGDALAHLNPRFGSGMSAASFQAEMLRDQLAEAAAAARARSPNAALTSADLRGYSNKVQQQAAKAVELPYTLVRDGDLQYDFCTGPRSSSSIQSFMGAYINAIQDLLPRSPEVASTWMTVSAFLKPPSHLFKPVVMRKVLAHLLAQQWSATSTVMRLCMLAASMLLSVVLLKGVRATRIQ
ncbi:hypothetical protein WJX74_004084 [Apatococcus lobatus]|uniref:FAD-binding domain-containing protein n=1 Tax=Apatococcus lobatus TaxID=904363 RepID=A0AAW1S2S3_9CHLO